MKKNKLYIYILSSILITSCGGGGGGGMSDNTYGDTGGSTTPVNTAPVITNTSTSISVAENQTSAFTITATDADNDSLTYTISGTDASLFSVSSSGVVTFNTAPDFENPSDSDTNNVYQLSAMVTDTSSANDTESFSVTVINDTSDDVTSTSYDGTVVQSGYVQSADVCIPVNNTCTGATYSTTTAADGTFSITLPSNISGSLIAENGFDPVTNDQANLNYSLGEPVKDQNIIISPLTTSLDIFSGLNYSSLKTALNIPSTHMLRFDDPFSNLSNAASSDIAAKYVQVSIIFETMEQLDTYTGGNDSAEYKFLSALSSRTGTETSLGDTTFIRDMLQNWNFSSFTLTNEMLENLSASLSSFLQVVTADTSNAHSYFASVAENNLTPVLKNITTGSADATTLNSIIFDTLTWVNSSATAYTGTFANPESALRTTSYEVGNSGSAYYTVDGINADSTPLIIYARVGDTIVFEPSSSSVFSGHPFELSSSANDTSGTNNIGANEGWDQSSHTLTVTSSTPTTIYPHCGVHSGMYTNGSIQIVDTFSQNLIDITSASGAIEVKGTVSVGPYKGASGYTRTVYLRTADAGSDQHAHQFNEYPGLTFYMPADQGYHGASMDTASITNFKTKSHYASSGNSNTGSGGGSGGTGY